MSNMHAIELGVRSGSKFLRGGNASAVLSTCRAIMRYHQAKMDEINEYIRDLWLKIYKGSGKQRHVPYTTLSSTFYLTPLSPPLHLLHCPLPSTSSTVTSPPPSFPDIDRVEIRSEDDMEESRQRQRRTYKYRVSRADGVNELRIC